MAARHRGRPTRLAPDVQERICKLVTAGAPLPYACEATGIPWSTCKAWVKRGREGLEPYASFVAAWEQAKGAWVSGSVLRITKAAEKDWKAAAWLLERRVRTFQRQERIEHTGAGGGPVEVAQPVPYREAMAELGKLAREHPELAATIERATKGGP